MRSPDTGLCSGAQKRRWFFNPLSGDCERFVGGCDRTGPRQNLFKTPASCMGACRGSELTYMKTLLKTSELLNPCDSFMDIIIRELICRVYHGFCPRYLHCYLFDFMTVSANCSGGAESLTNNFRLASHSQEIAEDYVDYTISVIFTYSSCNTE